MVRENSFTEAFNFIKQMDSMRENKIKQQLNESIQRHKDDINRIQNIRESREMKQRAHSRLIEDCKNDALGTVIKAIYIEALDPSSLTDNGIILAESLVDSWIKSKGGASRIIALNRNKTYLLNTLCNIAEKAAFLEAEEIEGAEKEEESENKTDSEQEKQNKVSELMAQAQELIAKATAIQNGEDVDEDPVEDAGEDSGDSVSADDMSSDDGESEEPAEEEPTENEGEEAETEAEDTDSEEDGDDTTMDSDSDEDIDDMDDEEDSDDDTEDSDDEEDEDDLDDDGESDEDEDDDVDSVDSDNEDDLDNDGESDEDEDDDVDSVDDDDMTMDSDSDEDIDDIEDQDIEDDGAEDGSDISDIDDGEPTTVNGEKQDGTPGAKGKIFDELEDEEDVKKAVQIISQRVADAEEDFVKRNAEDKKKIDDLIGKISDNIKTVEKISDNDDPKSKVAEESVRMYNRQIKNITENRPMKAFEKIVRKLSESALKDTVLKETYTLENGRLDIGGIIESAKVMYGFLEALNTLQLERVDKEYMANVIKEL